MTIECSRRSPSQDLGGVLSAREFVWWYNGHPECRDLPVDLSGVESVAILGLGNVAIDCARILLSPIERLAATDIAEHALERLRASAVREVHLVARRGPVQVRERASSPNPRWPRMPACECPGPAVYNLNAQAACTPKELREVLEMVGPNLVMAVGAASAADEAELKQTRMKRRVYDILSKAAANARPG